MAKYGFKGYNTLLTCDKKIPADDKDETKGKGVFGYNLINKTDYNEVISAQEHMVYFQIIEEAKTNDNNYGNERQAWMKLSGKVRTTTGTSKKLVQKKITKYELHDVTRETK